MGVRILKREYGNAFAPSTEPKPDWLIGNTGDWLRLKMEVEAGVDFLATQQDPISLNKEERSIKIMNGKKWNDYGFDTGAEITFTYKVDTVNEDVTTTETIIVELETEQLFADTLIYKLNPDMNSVPFDTLPTDRGNIRVYSVKLFDNREMQGVRMKYTNIENAEAENHTLKSFIDGTETELICSGIDTLTAGWKEMEVTGNQSGMSVNGARIRKTSTTDTPVYESFTVTETNTMNLATRRSNTDWRRAWAVPVVVSGGKPNYKNVSPNNQTIPMNTEGTYETGQNSQVFLYNASSDNTKKFDLNMNIEIVSTNKNNTQAYIRFVLARYNGGASLTPVEQIELKRWDYDEFAAGSILNYQDVIIQDIKAGESYALVVEWTHENHSTTARYINVKQRGIYCSIYEFSEGFTSYKKKYDIEIDYMLSSFFEEITDLENNEPPAVVFDANSLTDSIDLMFLPEWNNPNIHVSNDMKETERLGNTGWFNENYNGLKNNFKVESVEYKDLGGSFVAGLSYGSDTKIKVVISGVKNLGADSDFKYGFIWLPIDEAQYKDKTTPFHQNTKVNSIFSTVAYNPNIIYPYVYEGYSEDAAKMNVRAVSFTIDGANLIFEAIFSPTLQFREFFLDRNQDRKYAIWVSVADRTLQTNYSDRVSLLADVNDMDYFITISGELPNVSNKFIEHPENNLVAGVDIYNGFLEDDILARSFFTLDKDIRLDQIIMGYEVENVVTGLTYELDRFTANTQQFNTLPSGAQQIDFNGIRGYKMEPNNNKNWVKIIRDTASDGNGKFGYQILFAAKIRWEDWIERTNVPTEFYNKDLKLNGYNNDWLGYLRDGGTHKINYFMMFDVINGSGVLRYKNKFEIRFNGYDENSSLITTHKYYDAETNALLSAGTDVGTGRPLGILLSNKNTRIEITYEKTVGNWDLGNVYGIIGLEIYEGSGVMNYRQLSSIWGSENDNILIPLPSNSKLRVELVEPNIIKTSCLIDYTRLSPAAKYKITGRIGCFKNNNGIPIDTRVYESRYETKYE